MNLTPLLIAFVVFSGLIIGMGEYYSSIQDVYAPAGNSSSAGNFTRFNETFTNINSQLEQAANHTVGVATKSLLDPSKYYDVLLTMFDVGGIIMKIPGVLMITVSQVSDMLIFIPSWIKYTIISVISIIIIMKVVAIFMKTGEI
jgi:hypothetical protein